MPANIVVPEVGESIVDARVAKWLKKEGDASTPAIRSSSSRPTRSIWRSRRRRPACWPDRARRRRRREGRRGARRHRGSRRAAPSASSGAPTGRGKPTRRRPRPARQRADRTAGQKTRATPAARNAAQQNEVDLAQVRGSGDAGRVMRRDVEQAASQPARQRPRQIRLDVADVPHTPRRPGRSRRRPSARIAARSRATAPKSACACRSAARRSPGASSKRRAPPPC